MLKFNNKTIAGRIWRRKGTIKTFAMITVIVCCGILYSCGDDASKWLAVDEQTYQAQEESVKKGAADADAVKPDEHMQMIVTADNNNTVKAPDAQRFYVYVCGSVINPGVYEAAKDARIYMLVEMAGGLTDDAADWLVNMAEPVSDGQTVYIPSKEQADDNSGFIPNTQQDTPAGGKININTATKEKLMTLRGIGESKAEDIIGYRNANGKFNAIEDIMKVSGIKEAAYNKIKDYICVK